MDQKIRWIRILTKLGIIGSKGGLSFWRIDEKLIQENLGKNLRKIAKTNILIANNYKF